MQTLIDTALIAVVTLWCVSGAFLWRFRRDLKRGDPGAIELAKRIIEGRQPRGPA